jgi:hypothetical protein
MVLEPCGMVPWPLLLQLSWAITLYGHFTFIPSWNSARCIQWFGTYNSLQRALPEAHTVFQTLCRQAFIGFTASVVSDTISNSLRVVKTYRQVNETRIGYINAARAVILVDGWRGLFGRGLKTRILANGLQGLMFSILWKLFLDLWVMFTIICNNYG